MCVYLRTKFQVSSIILTSFRQGGGVILSQPPLTTKETPKNSILIRVKDTHWEKAPSITFCLTKTENRTKTPLKQLSYYYCYGP